MTSATLHLDGSELLEYPLVDLEGSFSTLKDVDLYMIIINTCFSFKRVFKLNEYFQFCCILKKLDKIKTYFRFKRNRDLDSLFEDETKLKMAFKINPSLHGSSNYLARNFTISCKSEEDLQASVSNTT